MHLKNLDEMDKVVEKHNLPKTIQEEEKIKLQMNKLKYTHKKKKVR